MRICNKNKKLQCGQYSNFLLFVKQWGKDLWMTTEELLKKWVGGDKPIIMMDQCRDKNLLFSVMIEELIDWK